MGRAGQPAGPASLLGQVSQVRFLPFVFLFYFSDICFDLVKILNHFIYLCQFLQGLVVLFQSSSTNGIIF